MSDPDPAAPVTPVAPVAPVGPVGPGIIDCHQFGGQMIQYKSNEPMFHEEEVRTGKTTLTFEMDVEMAVEWAWQGGKFVILSAVWEDGTIVPEAKLPSLVDKTLDTLEAEAEEARERKERNA